MGESRAKGLARMRLANQASDARPTVDNVHDYVMQATIHGLTYEAMANALKSSVSRVERWSAGADIPESVSERRAILKCVAHLLTEMSLPLAELPRLLDQERWRRAEGKIRQSGDVLCMECQRRRATNDNKLCGRRSCRLRAEKVTA
jgi:hypothetical protein